MVGRLLDRGPEEVGDADHQETRGKNQESWIRNLEHCEGLQGAANRGILDQPGALGDLCHTVPHLQLLDLGGDRKRGNQGVGRPPKMSLFEFQAGRPNCNPLLPQLSPLQASKICKLIPFLTKGDSGFIISSDCEG